MARNAYGDLPMPQRAQDIVAEARQRLAANGGKASMLPAMIQKVTEEYRSRDDANDQFRGTDSFNMPNNMESYIDRVLQMSGMTGDNNAGGNGSDTTSAAAPAGEVTRAPLPDVEAAQDDNTKTPVDEGMSLGQVLLGVLGVGGVAGAAKLLYDKYGRKIGEGAADVADSVQRQAAAGAANEDAGSAVDDMIARIDGTDGKQPRLAAPNEQLPPPNKQVTDQSSSAVDDEMERTMTQDDIDQVFQDRVEGRAGSQTQPGPNRFAGDTLTNDLVDRTSPVLQQASEMADKGDIRGAVLHLRQNGIELNEDMLRQLVEGANKYKSLASRAAGDAVRGAVRTGVR